MNVSDVMADIKRHEGFRSKVYKCPADRWTIGFGRNVEDVGITEDEAEHLLLNDLMRCEANARAVLDVYPILSAPRQGVIVNMIYNLGLSRFLGFKKLLAALAVMDFELAAHEMLDSTWATQVGDRAEELAEIMRTGVRE